MKFTSLAKAATSLEKNHITPHLVTKPLHIPGTPPFKRPGKNGFI
jgi:hypothetical protein